MRKIFYTLFIAFLAIIVVLRIYSVGHQKTYHAALQLNHNLLKISESYVRVVSPNAKSGAIFFTIENGTDSEVLLSGVKTDVAKRAELHSHKENKNGVMSMMKIESGVKIAPNSVAVFKRGGQHIMLMGLNQSLENGDIVPIELIFQDQFAQLNITVDNDRLVEHSSHWWDYIKKIIFNR